MSDTDETATNGRNELGRFEPGNQCSKGRQNHSAELKRAFTEAVTVQDIENIVKTLVRMAADGDVPASKLVLDRALGKPDSGPMVALQINQASNESDDRVNNALRLAGQIKARRAALFTGAGMNPPTELQD